MTDRFPVAHGAYAQALDREQGSLTVNLGTGRGYSVLEAVAAFERACGAAIPVKLVGRRPGDVGASFADPSRAAAQIGWKAELDLDAMCRDAWRWQSQNPQGYP